jgi:hypothetical protein
MGELGLIIAGVALVAGVFEDLYTWIDVRQSLIRDLIGGLCGSVRPRK